MCCRLYEPEHFQPSHNALTRGGSVNRYRYHVAVTMSTQNTIGNQLDFTHDIKHQTVSPS